MLKKCIRDCGESIIGCEIDNSRIRKKKSYWEKNAKWLLSRLDFRVGHS
jgi:hypothetical protein